MEQISGVIRQQAVDLPDDGSDRLRTSVSLHRRVALLWGLLPFTLLVATGLYGLDFGFHWDEGLLLNKVQYSIDSGILLPEDFYNYPSMAYWVSLLGSGTELIPTIRDLGAEANLREILGGESFGIRSQLSSRVLDDGNRLRVRALFLLLSSLSVIWVYLLQWVWRRNWVEALLAAAIIGLSWEVAYHLRWIAPDGLLLQFGALTMLFFMLSQLRPENGRVWLRLAAVAAGLTCGSKYQGGLFLAPVLLAAFLLPEPGLGRRRRMFLAIEVTAIFGLSYLITTPGTVLVPLEFARDVFFERVHYQAGHHGHSVAAGWEHLRLNLDYFAFALLSRNPIGALVLFACSLLGIVALFRESSRLALLFVSFPFLYILLMSAQSVMILRNLLVLVPFLAILAARGVALLWQHGAGRRLARPALAVAVILPLSFNLIWLVSAAETIRNRSTERYVGEAAAYVAARPATRFYLSEQVAQAFAHLNHDNLPNVAPSPAEDVDLVLFYKSEGMARVDWPATRRTLTVTWFGPMEVNISYYPNWAGDDRILLMAMQQAREIGIAVIR